MPSALDIPQDPPPNQTDELTRPQADDSPREARDAEERIYRVEGLRDIRDGTIRKDDEQIEKDVRGDYERGKEVDGHGDDGQEGREKVKEDDVEEPDDMRKS